MSAEGVSTEGGAAPRGRFGLPYTLGTTESATFVELFFDLVFVFAVTEVTAMTLEHLDWEGVARSALIFWMIWWAWSQWTWALNPANAEHHVLRVGALVGTGIAFLMSASVGDAFGDDGGLWFAVPYVLVRLLGLGLYLLVAAESPERYSSLRMFALASLPGMVVVIAGGFADADVRGWWWLAAMVLDVGAAMVAGRAGGWGPNAAHFAERHGLFVIIALGESLIVVGLTVSDGERTGELLAVAIGAVTVGCLLWWSYFGWLKDDLEYFLERARRRTTGVSRAMCTACCISR